MCVLVLVLVFLCVCVWGGGGGMQHLLECICEIYSVEVTKSWHDVGFAGVQSNLRILTYLILIFSTSQAYLVLPMYGHDLCIGAAGCFT